MLATLALNYLVFAFTMPFLTAFSHDYIIASAVGSFVVMIINFLNMNFFIFKEK